MSDLGKTSEKKRLFFGHCPKGGGGVQPESKSFEVVLFSPILTFFWTINGGRGEGGGGGPCSKSFEALFA